MGLVYISILLIATAFLIVTVYICYVMKRVRNHMGTLSSTLNEVEKHLQTVTPRLATTLEEAGRFVDDATEKAKATDSVFDSVELLGETLQTTNTAIQNSISLNNLTDEELDRQMEPFIESIRWSEVAVKLYGKWKNDASKQNEFVATGREG